MKYTGKNFIMPKRCLPAIAILLTILCSAPALSGTIKVPGDVPTIQAGIDLALDFDTVLVDPGIYTENISILDKALCVLSSEGPSVTTLAPDDPDSPALTVFKWTKSPENNFRPKFSGFSITGGGNGNQVYIDLFSKIEISGNIFHHNIPLENRDNFVIVCAGDSSAPIITRNIFYKNYGQTCILVERGSALIINNTFDANRSAMIGLAGGGTGMNNIITNCIGTAVDGVFLKSDYNDLWNNTADYG